MSDMRLVGYFPAEAHKQDYSVGDIPAGQLTHVIYAFAGLQADGTCVSVDTSDDNTNFPLLFQLKRQYPDLQILISVGGGHPTLFSSVAASEAKRRTFVQTAVQFMTQNGVGGFDGIDIDWEFPGKGDSANFTTMLQELRNELDAQGDADGRHYLLTIAAAAGQSHFKDLQLAQIHPYLDWINLMTYNFTAVSSATTDLGGPLKAYDPAIKTHATHNVDFAVQAYLEAGVPAGKILAGVRFVATGWAGVPAANNGLYQTNSGAAPGTWDNPNEPPTGSLGFQDIEDNYLPTYTRSWENAAEVPWLFSPDTGIMISYEDQQSVTAKANYVTTNQLGGIMIWELAADDGQATLVDTIAGVLTPNARGLTPERRQ
jgi:chitinase